MSRVDLLLVLVVILIIVLIWRGPSMLPQIGAALGLAVKSAREKMEPDDDGAAPTPPPAPSDADDADPPAANRP
jgi:Sec-independent protein translocase protein TatA